MSDASVSAASPITSKKMGSTAKTTAAAKKPKNVPAHPKVSDMVTTAITALKERGGSSLQAIKKHIASNHKVDVDRLSPFIKKFLKSAVASGTLVQTKGKGATGSFKLSGGQKTKEPKSVIVPKAKKVLSSSSSTSVKKDTPKKPAKTPSSAKKLSRAKPAKAPEKKIKKKTPVKKQVTAKKLSKAKTPKKAVKATKPKSPKPKKAPKKAAVAKKPTKK